MVLPRSEKKGLVSAPEIPAVQQTEANIEDGDAEEEEEGGRFIYRQIEWVMQREQRTGTWPVCARPPASQFLRHRAELVWMSGDSGDGSGVLMLEWRSPGEEGVVLLG
ncbi:hypothetical protein BHM03_00054337, partial [Ensete ventricosum]